MNERTAGNLTTRRLKLCLSQQRLAELAGIDQSRVSRAESGKLAAAVVEELHRVIDQVERERATVELAEADLFWKEVGDAPYRQNLLRRLEAVAEELLYRPLRDAEFGRVLVDCLPPDSRKRLGV